MTVRLRGVGLSTLALCSTVLTGVLLTSATIPAFAADKPTAGSPALAASAKKPESSAPLHREVLSIARGDTLMEMLTDADVPQDEAHDAIGALRKVYDPRKLQIGQQVTVLFEPRRGGRRFAGFEFVPDGLRSVAVSRDAEDGFATSETERDVSRRPVARQGVINSSLFEAGSAAGVPLPIMLELIRNYSYDVDFQRDLQPGDRFEVLFERLVDEDGKPAGEGDVLYASLVLSGKEMPIYRHKSRDGRFDYYNRDGESIRRALLRTPIDGARITSGFGMRRHPILGFSKMHKGTDFGAPTGTPIYAAGDGVVEEVGRKGAYGNYIRIKHNTQISTAYAHLSRFAKMTRRGGRVEQGDIIGYVGTTGRSTGPHLHFELLKAGRQMDPRGVDMPTGEKLNGRELKAFQQTVRAVDKMFEDSQSGLQLARYPSSAQPETGCRKASSC